MSNGDPHIARMVQQLWPRLTRNPELHLHSLDWIREAGLFIRMPEGAYRAASFLDGRTFDTRTQGCWVPFQRIKEAVLRDQPPAVPLHFIFHMGHTGSTLVSRLIDETGVVQPLREPLLLREWAQLHDRRGDACNLASPDEIDAVMEIMLRLWARCPPGVQSAIVKATSTAARVGPTLMAARESARAVYLSMAAEPYLAVILAGSRPHHDIRGHAEERCRRLAAHLGEPPRPLHSLGLGQTVAVSWLAEALTREALRKAAGNRLLVEDFDEVLADIPAGLNRILAHLGLPDGPEVVDRIANSPVLGQYSKAPEHAYSRQLRRQVMDQSRRENQAEIASGMAFLGEVAMRHDAVEALIR